jgi:hypothetical protein
LLIFLASSLCCGREGGGYRATGCHREHQVDFGISSSYYSRGEGEVRGGGGFVFSVF